jgi:hypothetical protein
VLAVQQQQQEQEEEVQSAAVVADGGGGGGRRRGVRQKVHFSVLIEEGQLAIRGVVVELWLAGTPSKL